MQQFKYQIKYPVGLHARPSEMLSRECKKYSSDITITRLRTGKEANAKNTMSIMRLGVIEGELVQIIINGNDENIAIFNIKNFIENNL